MLKALPAFFGMGLFLACLFTFGTPASAEEAAGQKIFTKHKCAQCHTIEALKIAKVESEEEAEEETDEEKVDPPDLSGVGKERTAEWIVKWEKKEEKIKGRKHKKKFKGTEEELTTLADWLATLKFDVPKKKSEVGKAPAKKKVSEPAPASSASPTVRAREGEKSDSMKVEMKTGWKEELKAELKMELKTELKAELKAEILSDLKNEPKTEAKK